MDDITKKETKITGILRDKPYLTISQLSRYLGLDYKNTHRYCKSLYKKGFVSLNPPPEKSKRGSPVKVSLIVSKNDEDTEYNFLNILNQNKGRMEQDRLIKVLNESKDIILDTFGKEKIQNSIALLWGNPHVRREIVLTKKGKDFLKKISKRKERKEELKELIKQKQISKKR